MSKDHLLLGLLPYDDTRLKEWINTAADLEERLEDQPHSLAAKLDAEVSSSALQIGSTSVSGWARLRATAGFQGTDRSADVYCTGIPCPLRPDANLGLFDLEATLGSQLQASADISGGTLGLRASLGAGIRYRHYLPVLGSRRRDTAYTQLITGSCLPQMVDLGQPLEIGEVHRLDAKLSTELGIEAKVGKHLADDLVFSLSDGLSIPFKTDVRAAVEAALGLSFAARMMLVVGRACTHHDGWTRIRIQRESERKLSFGLTFALTMSFDMGTGLAQMFEEMIDSVPTPRLVRTARKILEYGDPKTLEKKLTDEAAEVLQDLLAEKIIDSLDEVVDFAQEVVDFYDGLEGELQGLWDRLLSKVDLDQESGRGQRVRQWLDRLADLESSAPQLDDLLAGNDDIADLVDVIEALTGKTVEDLLFDDGLEQAARRVAGLAQQATGLLDNTPTSLVGRIRKFSQATGIEKIIEDLRAFDSKKKLDDEVNLRLRRVAERLVGKGWDAIDAEDLQKISAWAKKVDHYLSFADLEDPGSEANHLANQIKEQLKSVKLDYGLSLAFEIERIARDTALLDVEIDPKGASSKLLRPFSRALLQGDVREALQTLVDWESRHEEKAKPEEEVSLPYSIRECVFTSERIRTSAFSAIFNLAGLGHAGGGKTKSFTRRVRQSSLKISPSQGKMRRTTRHASGFIRGNSPGKMSAGSGVWLITEDSGPGADLDQPYGEDPSTALRLAFWYEDDSADATELRGLDFLLIDLGFLPDPRHQPGQPIADPRSPSQRVEPGRSLKLSLDVQFPANELLGDLVSRHADAAGRRAWDLAFLNATHRWADETFVTGAHKGSDTRGKTMGQILAAVSANSFFVQHGQDVGHFRGELSPGDRWNVPVGSTIIPLQFNPWPGHLVELAVAALVMKRQALPNQLKALDRVWKTSSAPRTEADYAELSQAFVHSSVRMSLHRQSWPNPMSLFWLWLAAITEMRPDALAQGTGVAILRHEVPGTSNGAASERDGEYIYTANGVPDNRPPAGRIFDIRG